MSLTDPTEAAVKLIATGFEPEFWINDLSRWELIEQNTTVRLTMSAAMRRLLYVRYTMVMPRASLQPMAAKLIKISDLMEKLDRDRVAGFH